MKTRFTALFTPLIISLLFTGCVTTVSHSDSVPAPKSAKQSASAVVIGIDSQGHLHTVGWELEISDIPELVKQRHPSIVVIRGYSGAAFSKAVQVRDAFKAAGVSNVTISTVDAGAGG